MRRPALDRDERRARPATASTASGAAAAPPAARTVSDQVSAASAAAASTVPGMSRPGGDSVSRLSGTCRSATTTTSAATGRLIRNTARQVHSTSQPPTNGPTAPAIPPSPDQAPIAAARSGPRNDAEISARLPGVSSAPPTPCRARPATSSSRFGADPHSSDATANQHHADHEHAAAPEPVAQRAAEKINEASVRV
jgi:hypothetical protein